MTAPLSREQREAVVVEEVARAIYDEQGCRVAWHRLIDEDREHYRRQAAAAIAAYRATDGDLRTRMAADCRCTATDLHDRDCPVVLAPQAGDGAR